MTPLLRATALNSTEVARALIASHAHLDVQNMVRSSSPMRNLL